MNAQPTLTLAITKGRILGEALPLLARARVAPPEDIATTRQLVF
ncbi:MAG TPA: ATP phosphoribosyltransferase, partial [Acidobacteria bacterium]|nr:ATP phosphoribosyltransferase [Acidobacteriota bacterium]